ncbi:MAG: hypothetical protein LUI14_14580 [Lachnospiraceae bacterium]|nr:hypothetical protein [Lachnospiraceae bacterium]
MKLTFSELVRNHQYLMEVGNLVLPRKITVAIHRNLALFEKEIETMNKQRLDVVNRYALKDEKGNPVIRDKQYCFASDEDKEAYLTEQHDIDETEFDLNIATFDESEFDRCEEVERYDIPTAVQEMKLDWMTRKKGE